MEALHEVVVGELQHPSQQIVKGKRTKRQRPSSPIPFTVAHAHSASGEGVGYSSNVDNTTWENNNNSNNDNNQNGSNLKLSLGGSSEDANSTTTEEEDVARLLILLSQGCSRESPIKNDYLDHNYYPPSPKFTSKKYIETSTHANVKSGMFVYECKTCNRTFSSFQALGGHRASHKKSKNLASEEIKKRHGSSVFRYDYDYDFNPSPISFSRSNSYSNLTSYNSTTSNKIHECFYCGAEFTSGQALGGHMRRHRGSNGNNNSAYKYYYENNIHNIQPLSSLRGPLPVNEEKMGLKKHEIANDNKDALALSLSLDLNLPAENEQKNQEWTKLEFVTEKVSPSSPQKPNEKQQTDNNSSGLLCNTTPTLLNCHD